MARVHEVDPSLIDRTRRWLLAQRNVDGSWLPDPYRMHVDPTQRGANATLSTTAYIAWSVFRNASARAEASLTRDYLLSRPAASIDDPYVLALVCNDSAVAGFRRTNREAVSGTPRCDEAILGGREVGLVGTGRWCSNELPRLRSWWQRRDHGSSGARPNRRRFRAGQCSRARWRGWPVRGTRWGPSTRTQATRARAQGVVGGHRSPAGGRRRPGDRDYSRKRGRPNGLCPRPTTAETVPQVDLSDLVGIGDCLLGLTDRMGSGAGYQVVVSYYVPDRPSGAGRRTADRQPGIRPAPKLAVDDSVTVTATVRNTQSVVAPMVIVDLPTPAGFVLHSADFDQLVRDGVIAKYQANAP